MLDRFAVLLKDVVIFSVLKLLPKLFFRAVPRKKHSTVVQSNRCAAGLRYSSCILHCLQSSSSKLPGNFFISGLDVSVVIFAKQVISNLALEVLIECGEKLRMKIFSWAIFLRRFILWE